MDNSNFKEFKAVTINNGVIEIHPYRESEMIRDQEVVDDIYEIFGDLSQIPFNHEKFIDSKKDFSTSSIIREWHRHIRYIHFVSYMPNQKIIGQIIISPPVKEYYKFQKSLKNVWMIEYYLNKTFWNKGIMSSLIPAIIQSLNQQGITNIGAVVDRLNTPSVRVLEKSGFVRIGQFDDLKDYYLSYLMI